MVYATGLFGSDLHIYHGRVAIEPAHARSRVVAPWSRREDDRDRRRRPVSALRWLSAASSSSRFDFPVRHVESSRQANLGRSRRPGDAGACAPLQPHAAQGSPAVRRRALFAATCGTGCTRSPKPASGPALRGVSDSGRWALARQAAKAAAQRSRAIDKVESVAYGANGSEPNGSLSGKMRAPRQARPRRARMKPPSCPSVTARVEGPVRLTRKKGDTVAAIGV